MSSFYGSLQRYADRTALIASGGRSVSYAMLDRGARSFGRMIGEDRRLVFLEVENSIAALTAYVGCLIAGHVVYPFARGSGSKTDRLVELYQPNAVVTFDGDEAVVTRPSDRPVALHDDLRLLLSTSGSTGSPKFVKLSARNIQSNAGAIAEYLELDESERAITSLKPSYSYGLSVVHSHLECGGSLLLTDDSVTDAGFWSAFRDHEATSFAGVPYTFELIMKSGLDLGGLPLLRYVTQAGGRLPPEHVERFARQSAAQGWRFYVMYGQTEAAPRIAYLPPDAAAERPAAVGIPVPGGRIDLLDEDGSVIVATETPGVLVYSGPNVMMGYAETRDSLANDETPSCLRTGDIAVRHSDGLISIVGRESRFVKPFGVRVNLEEVERDVAVIAPGAVATGNDDLIVVALPPGASDQQAGLARTLGARYGLPEHIFVIAVVDVLPRLDNGKLDYRRLLAEYGIATVAGAAAAPIGFWRTIVSPAFYRVVIEEAADILGLKSRSWGSVRDLYLTFLGAQAADGGSFIECGGDSMSYVQLSLALEEYVGSLPEAWAHLSQSELEAIRDQPAAF